jgi:myo-inositol-1(or 4)-monophosphatase
LARRLHADPRRKADGTRVSDADFAAQDILLRRIGDAFPDDVLRSEECDPGPAAPGRATWWIDPLDGTSPFLEGLAHWGPTVAREVDGAFVAGAFHTPRTGEHWFAARGVGAFHDGRRLQPAPVLQAGRDDVLALPSAAHRAFPIPWPGRIRALGSTAAHLAMVASGGAAAGLVAAWSPWDIGAGALLVIEAGRVLTDLSGTLIDPMKHPEQPFLAASPALVGTLCAALEPARAARSSHRASPRRGP